jgi:hypothetical protein
MQRSFRKTILIFVAAAQLSTSTSGFAAETPERAFLERVVALSGVSKPGPELEKQAKALITDYQQQKRAGAEFGEVIDTTAMIQAARDMRISSRSFEIALGKIAADPTQRIQAEEFQAKLTDALKATKVRTAQRSGSSATERSRPHPSARFLSC